MTGQQDCEPSGQALLPGTRLEEFVIERELGSGGFGITYLARDTGLNRQVVIKENLPAQFAWRETTTGTVRPRHTTGGDVEDFNWSMKNFLREAETLASLDHPGIVRVLRKFEANGTAYFVMPFVEGIAFKELIEQRKAKAQSFSEDELRGLLEHLLSALGYLHDRGIYHRDVKPDNILISNGGIPALIDFGSARQRLGERSMTVVESAGYTPFEQLQSHGDIGPWSDVYALGATLVKAITFQALPKATDRVLRDPWNGLNSDPLCQRLYSSLLLQSVEKAVAVDPLNRWRSCDDWHSALTRSVPVVDATCFPSVPPRLPFHSLQPTPAVDLPVIPATLGDEEANPDGEPLISAFSGRQATDIAKKFSKGNGTVVGVAAGLVAVAMVIWIVIRLAPGSATNTTASGQSGTANSFSFSAANEDPSTWLKMAESGDPLAQGLLARECLNGIEGDLRGYKDAAEWARKSASQNHPLGLFLLGRVIERDLTLPSVAREEESRLYYSKAFHAGFLTNAELGGKQWIAVLGSAYFYGDGVSKDEAEALRWYRKAANMGDSMGMANLGAGYFYGKGVPKDEDEAARWYRKSADLGNGKGMVSLGDCLASGNGAAKNEAEALVWYRKAANAGNSEGMCRLGLCLISGSGVSRDEHEAVKWFQTSANLGNPEGMWRLGLACLFGTGVPKDERVALEWYRKSADAGNSDAMCRLGACFAYGTGVTKNEAEAAKWYRKAAEFENSEGMWRLGLACLFGTGVTEDKHDAVKWFRQASEAGNPDGMWRLGLCFYDGNGVVKNDQEAAVWYRKAADTGNAVGMWRLGDCLARGNGVTKNDKEAATWYRKAAEAGNPEGMTRLGDFFRLGTGVNKDEREAAAWYRKAAEAGDSRGMVWFGWCYTTGTGVVKDEANGSKWYQKAADSGNAEAMYFLGLCYQSGTGVTKDEAAGIKWMRKASAIGHAGAAENLRVRDSPPAANMKVPPSNNGTVITPVAAAVPGKPGFVFSPHNNKVVDVRGISSGTLVQDPTYLGSEKKYFRVP